MKAPICTCVYRGLFAVGPLAGQCFCRCYDYRSTDTRKKVTGEKIHMCKNFTGAAEAAVPSWHFEMNDQTSSDVSLSTMGYPQKDPKELIWRGIDVHRN